MNKSYRNGIGRTLSGFGLILGLGACAIDNWKYPKFEGEPVRQVEITPFKNYNPRPMGDGELILEDLPESFSKYLAHYGLTDTKFLDEGMRGGNSYLDEKRRIENREKLVERILEEAFMEGYDEESVSELTPRQAIELSCLLASRRLRPDYSENQELARRIDGKNIADLYLQEDDKEIPAVCRHYAEMVAVIFRGMREVNVGIRNTYLTPYYNAGRKHAYDQATTINPGQMQITFVDSMWAETCRDRRIEAVDTEHFGRNLWRIEEEAEYLERKMPGVEIITK